MRHLVLPSDAGVATTAAEFVAKIVPVGTDCELHLHASDAFGVKKGTHNVIYAKLPAEEVRDAIANMQDGDVWDPCGFDTCGEE